MLGMMEKSAAGLNTHQSSLRKQESFAEKSLPLSSSSVAANDLRISDSSLPWASTTWAV
jgi:hypothetical protein